MVTTRLATASDEPRVLELLGQLWGRDASEDGAAAASFRRLIEGERGAVIVAEEGGMVLGQISVSFNLAIRYPTGYAQIEELVVDEAARGKRAGAILVEAAIDLGRSRGLDEIGLYPREETRPFYERLGFEYVGVELRQALR
jgi:GNAT superfamily N-acetyltransferase